MDRTVTAQYRNQQLLSSNPAMLVYLLYDEAIRSLQKAVEAISRNDIKGRWQGNSKAMEIIGELGQNLDMEKGGEIADQLRQLYTYLLAALPQVDIGNDAKPAENAIRLLEPLRESWRALAGREAAELNQAKAEALAQLTGAQHDGAESPDRAAPSVAAPRRGLEISA